MFDPNLFLDANAILVISLFLLILAGILFFFKKLAFGIKDVLKITGASVFLTLLSFLVQYKRVSGEGIQQGYGWPHDVYIVWLSANGAQSHVSFTPHYLVANIIFYITLVLFVFTLSKRRLKK